MSFEALHEQLSEKEADPEYAGLWPFEGRSKALQCPSWEEKAILQTGELQ